MWNPLLEANNKRARAVLRNQYSYSLRTKQVWYVNIMPLTLPSRTGNTPFVGEGDSTFYTFHHCQLGQITRRHYGGRERSQLVGRIQMEKCLKQFRDDYANKKEQTVRDWGGIGW